MFSRLRAVACILIRDPAARTAWEVLTTIRLHAVILHHRAHWCWTHGYTNERFILAHRSWTDGH
jgi:serine O-acetyltransferase